MNVVYGTSYLVQPLVGVASGIAGRSEPLGAVTAAGGTLILAGLAVTVVPPRSRSAPPGAPTGEERARPCVGKRARPW